MRKRVRLIILISILLPIRGTSDSVLKHLCDTIVFHNMATGMFSGGDVAPYWMTNNHYGLSTEKNNALIWRRAVSRSIDNDDARNWKMGWGMELSMISTCSDDMVRLLSVRMVRGGTKRQMEPSLNS